MDNRWSIRKDLCFDVVLNSYKQREVVAKTVNIGLEGAFIETEYMEYCKGDIIDVIIELPDRDRKGFKIQGVVIYIKNTGIGVMFIGFNLKAFRMMQRILYCERPLLNSVIEK